MGDANGDPFPAIGGAVDVAVETDIEGKPVRRWRRVIPVGGDRLIVTGYYDPCIPRELVGKHIVRCVDWYRRNPPPRRTGRE